MWISLQSRANIRCSLIGRDGGIRREDKGKWKGVTEGTGGEEWEGGNRKEQVEDKNE